MTEIFFPSNCPHGGVLYARLGRLTWQSSQVSYDGDIRPVRTLDMAKPAERAELAIRLRWHAQCCPGRFTIAR